VVDCERVDRDVSDLEHDPTDARPQYQEPAPGGTFMLQVVEGADRGMSFELTGDPPGRVLLGQSPACRVRLADREVSRRHAALELEPTRLRITDLGSTNGTYVDGVSVVEAYLRGDEIVRVGSTALRVHRGPPTAAPLPIEDRFGRVVGQSPELRALYPLFQMLAASSLPCVIEGETGTGKEVLAEALHEASPRASGPFVVFDCTAVPPNLVESELFGHERGAFTGAVAARRGVFEQAHGGTLLIDEIGDLHVSLQPKLLRAIERSEVRRVGADRPTRVDVRVLAATRRDLDRAVQDGLFRDDLFHRLAIARVELPPLRRRRGDVAVLARHFWQDLGGDPGRLTRDLLVRWEHDAWPGNVRQLRNAIARQLAFGDAPPPPLAGEAPASRSTSPSPPPSSPAGAEAEAEDGFFARVIEQNLPLPVARLQVVQAFEQQYIAAVLARYGGNVPKAAQASGLARRYFQILRTGARRRQS